jgi:Zn-dependent M28 family amino/carboxypeptidase
VVAGALLVPTALTAASRSSEELREAVTVEGIREHQAAFQEIADANGGTRASGTPGYEASVRYVGERLLAAGYRPSVQEFEFAFFRQTGPSTFEQVSPSPAVYVEGTDFETMEYSAPGDVTGTLVPTNDVIVPMPADAPASTSNSGCEPEDFVEASDTEPQVALIQRGTCTFDVKVANAAAAGYDAVVLFNEGQPGRTDALAGTLGAPGAIPAVFATYALGADLFTLAGSGPVTVHVVTQTESETRTTWNLIAETRSGNRNHTIVVGAHLDSVVEGPGINDNTSGSGTILEIAEEMAELDIRGHNRIRFIWFGAEENGLLGSEYYVSQLSEKEVGRIVAMLNFDMVGSPNYVRFVYDGDGDETGTAGPTGSDLIEDVFTDYFASQGLATDPTAFDGRSDYGPFIAVGIPAGGLFTGAEGLKTPEQAETYGGQAGVAFDPCYHQACDTFANVSEQALAEMSDAAAHAVHTAATARALPAARVAAAGAQSRATTAEFRGSHAIR